MFCRLPSYFMTTDHVHPSHMLSSHACAGEVRLAASGQSAQHNMGGLSCRVVSAVRF